MENLEFSSKFDKEIRYVMVILDHSIVFTLETHPY